MNRTQIVAALAALSLATAAMASQRNPAVPVTPTNPAVPVTPAPVNPPPGLTPAPEPIARQVCANFNQNSAAEVIEDIGFERPADKMPCSRNSVYCTTKESDTGAFFCGVYYELPMNILKTPVRTVDEALNEVGDGFTTCANGADTLAGTAERQWSDDNIVRAANKPFRFGWNVFWSTAKEVSVVTGAGVASAVTGLGALTVCPVVGGVLGAGSGLFEGGKGILLSPIEVRPELAQ